MIWLPTANDIGFILVQYTPAIKRDKKLVPRKICTNLIRHAKSSLGEVY